MSFCIADGFAKASPAAARAVTETVEALKAQDHECIEIEIPDGKKHSFCSRIWN